MTAISVKRSTQQISRSYAVRAIVGLDEFNKVYLAANARTTELPLLSNPKILLNEPDEVPMYKPL